LKKLFRRELARSYNIARTFFKPIKKKLMDLETGFCVVLN